MEFNIQKDLFLNSLKMAEHASSTKGIQVILANVYIEATEDNELIIKSSDLDIGVILKINTEVIKPGKITLPSKKMSEIVSKLPKDEVNFEASEETNNAKITSGRSKFDIVGISATEYPVVLSKEEMDEFKNELSIDIKTFNAAIKQTVYAASVAESNSIYNGVYFSVNGNTLEMASTDGARLSTVTEKIENTDEKSFETIIPSRTLNEFVRFQAGCDGDNVEILKRESQLIFKIGENILISRSIEGKYPKFKQIIPQNNDKIAVISRNDLINSLDRTSSMVEEKRNVVILTFEKEKLSFVVKNQDLGESNDEIDVEYNDETMKVAINYKYLLDVLRNYDSEKVKFELKQSNTPVLIRPEENDKYMALIMPIQIKE